MKVLRDYLSIALGSVWLLILTVSLLMFFLFHSGQSERVLFFPEYEESELKGEARMLPVKSDKESDIELLVREVVLGPMNIHCDRVLPKTTDVETVILRGSQVYIDFSLDPILEEEGSVLSFRQQIESVKRTIRFNFPSIKGINVSFRGQTPRSEGLVTKKKEKSLTN